MTAKRKPTSYHVAKLAGVSRTTVSFVLNNRADVAIPQKTRDAVLAAAKQLGYRPNRAASALASGTTKTVSLWLTSLSSVLYLNWIQHMQSQVSAKGYDLVFSEKGHHNDQAKKESHSIAEWPVDGIFAYGVQWLPAYLEAHPLHTPIVLMGHYYAEGFWHYDHVGLDLYTPTVECMKHLISAGYKNIAYFQGPSIPEGKTPRFQAYEDTMVEAGLATKQLISLNTSRTTAYESLRTHAEQHGLPDALVCANDDFAIAALRVASDLGLRIPEDIAIAGSDGLEETAYHAPRITTIELPYTEMCEIAWQFMENRVKNPTLEPQQATVPARLITRESTACTVRK